MRPPLKRRSFLGMQRIRIESATVAARRTTAAIQNGRATFVRNKRGIPVTAIPSAPRSATTARQTLWQTCHDPRMLVAPDTPPSAPATFSFPIGGSHRRPGGFKPCEFGILIAGTMPLHSLLLPPGGGGALSAEFATGGPAGEAPSVVPGQPRGYFPIGH